MIPARLRDLPRARPKLLIRVLPSADIADALRCACACTCSHPTHCRCSPCAVCAAQPRELEPMAGDDSDVADPTSAWGQR